MYTWRSTPAPRNGQHSCTASCRDHNTFLIILVFRWHLLGCVYSERHFTQPMEPMRITWCGGSPINCPPPDLMGWVMATCPQEVTCTRAVCCQPVVTGVSQVPT